MHLHSKIPLIKKDMNQNNKIHVVMVGAGFGGLNAAKILAWYPNISITIIDRRNYHLFQPLLYQVAMAGLSPAEIASPIRSILSKHKNIDVLLGEVRKVSFEENLVSGDFGEISYDYLLMACGSQHSYFGKDEWEEYAPGLKTLEQATEIRRRVLTAFEKAEREKNPELQKKLLTFVVIGGGPTGVELAGALAEISGHTLTKDFHNIDSRNTNIILIEAGDRILSSFVSTLSIKATNDLKKMGVIVLEKTRVTEVNRNGVAIGNTFIEAETVLWAAGVAPAPINTHLGVPLDPLGRIYVESDLTIKEHPNVFVIGDQAHCKDNKGQALPGLSPVAIQQGIHVAKNIERKILGKATEAFQYFDKGQMATIGRSKAVAQIGSKIRFSGFLAWLTWLFVHIYYLIGFKNRIFVITQWIWAYISYGRGARLIVEKEWHITKKNNLKGE